MAISGYTDIKGKNFGVVQVIGAISGYTENHHKELVETDHTYHNILSFDPADDRQHKSGWMSADHNTACFVLPLR